MHLVRGKRGEEIWPAILTKQPCLLPRRFLFVGAVLGGRKAEAVPEKCAGEIARGADTPLKFHSGRRCGMILERRWKVACKFNKTVTPISCAISELHLKCVWIVVAYH